VFTPVADDPGTTATTLFTLKDISSGYTTPSIPDVIKVASLNTDSTLTFGRTMDMDRAGDIFLSATRSGSTDTLLYEVIKTANGYAAPVLVCTFSQAQFGTFNRITEDPDGNLIGTTSGANGDGLVFEITKTATGFSGPVILATFGGADPKAPKTPAGGLLYIDALGNVFGTTSAGGTNGAGTVYELAHQGSSYGPLQVLFNFSFSSGSTTLPNPAALNGDSAGNLFGLTLQGGANGKGTLFELVKDATGYHEQILYTFDGSANFGGTPNAKPYVDPTGTHVLILTSTGGQYGLGAVLEFDKVSSSSSSWSGHKLFDFGGTIGSRGPGGLRSDSVGNLYGLTANGQVYEIARNAAGYDAPVLLSAPAGTFFNNMQVDADGNMFGLSTGSIPSISIALNELPAADTPIPVTSGVVSVFDAPYPIPSLSDDELEQTYMVGGAPVAIAPDIVVSEIGGDTLLSATIRITDGFLAGDRLNFVNQAGITGSYNAATGVLTLSGGATLDDYQAAIASITYSSTALDPRDAGNDGNRSIEISVGNESIVSDSLAFNIALDAPPGQVFQLPKTKQTIAGDAGDDTFVVTASTIAKGHRLDGGLGSNTLQLDGGGKFDLRTLKQLTNVGVISLTEGQAASSGYAGTLPVVALRAGLNAKINVDAGTPNDGNPKPLGITIIGVAGDSSTINLADGTSKVTLGSLGEEIVLGGGTVVINATNKTAGAWIHGDSEKATVNFTGGGVVEMNRQDSGITDVTLASNKAHWFFTSDLEAGLTIVDKSGGGDTISLLGADATVTLGRGADTLWIHEAPGHHVVNKFTATGSKHDVLEFDKALVPDWAHLLADAQQQGQDLLITFDANNSVLLTHVSLASFTIDDAIFV
jgi:hypothetical protein